MEIDYTRKITHTGYRNPEKIKKYYDKIFDREKYKNKISDILF